MKRSLYMTIACFALGFLIIILWASGALGYTIQGGTASERATIQAALNSAPVPVSYIEDAWGPYVFKITTERVQRDDGLVGGYSIAGLIAVTAVPWERSLVLGGEVFLHEYWHQVYWTLPLQYREDWLLYTMRGNVRLWRDWYTNPIESFAENARFLGDGYRYAYCKVPRTQLRNIDPRLLLYWLRPAWDSEYQYVPFIDLGWEWQDAELLSAAAYARGVGIITGYTDATLRAHEPLLKRHVALVAERMGLTVPPWLNNYSSATRGQVRDAIPGLIWTEERWGEPILRSQLLRLVYRAGVVK